METTCFQFKKNPIHRQNHSIVWNFNDLTGWEDATQSWASKLLDRDGWLTIYTNANTWERTKNQSHFDLYNWHLHLENIYPRNGC
jgi:hypothetical protein